MCFWLTFWLWDPPQRLSVVHYILLEICWMTACVGKVVLSAISTKFCCFKCLCLPSATFIGFGFSSPLPFFFYGAVFWAIFWKPWSWQLLSHGVRPEGLGGWRNCQSLSSWKTIWKSIWPRELTFVKKDSATAASFSCQPRLSESDTKSARAQKCDPQEVSLSWSLLITLKQFIRIFMSVSPGSAY